MKKALFVVDMVNGFIKEGAMHDEKIMAIVPVIKERIKEYQNEDVYFIADTHEAEAIEFNSFPKHCVKGTSESEIIDELKPFVHHLIEKNSTNTFHALDVEMMCGKYEAFEIVGCCSDICVMQFALSLKTYLNHCNMKKDVTVIKDGVATYDAPYHCAAIYHDMALKIMEQSGIIIHE